jgi:Fe-Mn family superoxide dismutase
MGQLTYKAKEFKLSGLEGISNQTLEMHFGLYQGYVKNTNLLTEQILEMTAKKRASGKDPAYAELTRRLGFEYGGMVLHEYYFENLAPKGKGKPAGELQQRFEQDFGGFNNWKEAFAAVGDMRGVGWAILYQDPVIQQLSNHWVGLQCRLALSPFSSWMFGNMPTCWTTSLLTAESMLRPSSRILTGTPSSGD